MVFQLAASFLSLFGSVFQWDHDGIVPFVYLALSRIDALQHLTLRCDYLRIGRRSDRRTGERTMRLTTAPEGRFK